MIRRPPKSTLSSSSAASDVYKRQIEEIQKLKKEKNAVILAHYYVDGEVQAIADYVGDSYYLSKLATTLSEAVSYTHLRAHETDSYLVCRLLLEKKKKHEKKKESRWPET